MLGKEWTVTPEVHQLLESYHWPGNVRQLKNALERAQILANDHIITIDDLPSEIADAHDGGHHRQPTVHGIATSHAMNGNHGAGSAPAAILPPPSTRLEDLEKAHIVDILRQQNGNKARTARVLGIHRRKLYRLLERYGITEERPVG